VEDSEDDVQLALRQLHKEGFKTEHMQVMDEAGLRRALANRDWEVVLSDHALPRFSSLEALTVVRKARPEMPFIVVSGTIGEDLAIQILKAGADDYVLKDRIARLGAAVRRAIKDSRARRDQENARLAVEERERQFRNLFEAAPLALLVFDRRGEIVMANANAFRSLSLPDLAALNNSANWAPPPYSHKAAQEWVTRAFSYGRQVTEWKARNDRWFEWVADRIRMQEEEHVIVMGTDVTERRQAEQALRASEEQFRAIANYTYDWENWLDADNHLIWVSPSVHRVTGYTADECFAMKDYPIPIIHPDDVPTILKHLERCNQAPVSDVEFRFVTKDGQTRWGTVSTNPVRNAAGQNLGHRSSVHDITDRKRVEDAMRFVAKAGWGSQNEGFLNEMVTYVARTLDVHCVLVGELLPGQTEVETLALFQDGHLQPTLRYSLKGTPCDQVVGKQMCCYPQGLQLLFPEDAMLVNMKAHSYAGIPLWTSGSEALGIFCIVDTKPWADTHLIEAVLQIMASRAAGELERRRAERQYQNLFTRMSTGFAVCEMVSDDQGQPVDYRYLAANPAFERLTGLRISDLLGRTMRQLLPQVEPLWIDTFTEVVQTGTPVRFERFSPEFNRHFEITAYQPAPKQFACLLDDVTERKRLQEQLIQADKMVSLGTLVAGIAHEINNPTNFITLNLPILTDIWKNVVPILDEYLERQGDFVVGGMNYSEMRDQIPGLLSGIADGANRTRNIVSELKDFARRDTGEAFTPIDINRVVKSATALMDSEIRKATARFSVQCEPDLPPVRGSFQRMEQVLINLIQNACHALPGRDKAIEIRTSFSTETSQVRMEVRDEGCGMTEDVRRQMKVPFFTTKRDRGGTGLGLAISSRIINDHGGTLELVSEPGKGTQAVVSLPALPRRTDE
jgi:PAS domain S-box-containing protein